MINPTPKPPRFSLGYKVFAVIIVLAIITAIGLPKVRQWLAAEMYLKPSANLSHSPIPCEIDRSLLCPMHC